MYAIHMGAIILREIDYLVIKAQQDEQILSDLIQQNEIFIIKSASKFSRRFITKSDDGYSVAVIAFHEAVNNYALEKGGFYAFAELVIRRRIIDYIRKLEKHKPEIMVNPSLFDTEPEEESEDYTIQLAIAKQVQKVEENNLKLEIDTVNVAFLDYGFSFFDLAECSPKAKKTKVSCAKAVSYILSQPLLLKEMDHTKQLPLKIIEKNTNLPRKILERHRKYIIAAVVILSGEYPNLAEYLHFIREENV